MATTIFKKPVDGALDAYDRGFKVFPLKPNDKRPAVNDWQAWALTASRQKIEDFGKANPTNNWGVFCHNNLLVIDVDNKNGLEGSMSLQQLEANNSKLPETLSVTTPSGGKHLYFLGSGKTTASRLAKAIDTRGVGGYVVAPGSRIDQRTYELHNGVDLAALPEWVSNQLGKANKEKVQVPETGVIEKGKQHETLVSLAGTMRSKGMTADSIYAALSVMNEQNLEEPAPDSHIRKIANSIGQYPAKEALAKVAFAGLEKAPKFKRSGTIKTREIAMRDWIMEDRYIGGFVSVTIAPGGVGKSTLALADALSLDTGEGITGFKVKKQGRVWVINTEDPEEEIDRRFSALCLHHNIDVEKTDVLISGSEYDFKIASIENGVVAINNELVESTIEEIKREKVNLLIVDPFVECHSVNENDNTQINQVVKAFRSIARRTGCAVSLVHHTRKLGASETVGNMDTARGASSLVSAARIANTLQPMSKKEAQDFNLAPEEASWYMRLDNAKANLQAPAEKAIWYKRESIPLYNDKTEKTLGDKVGSIAITNDLVNYGEIQRQRAAKSKLDSIIKVIGVLEPGESLNTKKLHAKLKKRRDTSFSDIDSNSGRFAQFMYDNFRKGVEKDGVTYRVTRTVRPNGQLEYAIFCERESERTHAKTSAGRCVVNTWTPCDTNHDAPMSDPAEPLLEGLL